MNMKMKAKMKALVVATAMALGAQAQAAINTDFGQTSAGDGSGAGELFLSVIDRGGPIQRSYVLDLGISAAAYRANEASYLAGGANAINLAADAKLLDILNNKTGTIAWNISAIDSRGNTNGDYENMGFLSTSATPLVANIVNPGGFGGAAAHIQKIGLYATAVNGQVPGAAGFDNALNASVIVTNTTAYAFHDVGFGNSWSTTFNSEGNLGDSLGFYFVGLDVIASPIGEISRVDTMLGKWSLSTTGTLSVSAAVVPPAVPVPAAVWLLGSALVGLVGVARRKSEPAVIS